MSGYGWRWPLLSRLKSRMMKQEEDRECPTVYYRDVIPEKFLPGFNFLISLIPYARVIVAEEGFGPEALEFYGLAFETPLGLFASGLIRGKDVKSRVMFLGAGVLVSFPRLGPEYYLREPVCLGPPSGVRAYTGLVVDVEGGVRMELPPEIAGVYSQVVTAKTALESVETADDYTVVNNILYGFTYGETEKIVLTRLLDVSIVERYQEMQRKFADQRLLTEQIEKDMDEIEKAILSSPAVRGAAERIAGFARTIPGYREGLTDPKFVMNRIERSILSIVHTYLILRLPVLLVSHTTADYIKQQPEVWRVTFPR